MHSTRPRLKPAPFLCLAASGAVMLAVSCWAGTALAAPQCKEATLAWDRMVSTTTPKAAALVRSPDGKRLLLAGDRDRPGVHNSYEFAPKDGLVLALDWESGDVIWQTLLDGVESREINAITTTNQGDVVLVGTMGIKPAAIGGYEEEFGWVARLTGDGEMRWEHRLGRSGALHGLDSVVPLAAGSVVVAGHTEVSSHESSDGQAWIMQLNEDGDIDWDIKLGGTVHGLLPKSAFSVKVTLSESETAYLEGVEIDGSGKLFPLWAYTSTLELPWFLAPVEGAGDDMVIRQLATVDGMMNDEVTISSIANTGMQSWERTVELVWPHSITIAGPDREVLVAPVAEIDAMSLIVLDARTGERVGKLEDAALGAIESPQTVGSSDDFSVGLFGTNPQGGHGVVARVDLACH